MSIKLLLNKHLWTMPKGQLIRGDFRWLMMLCYQRASRLIRTQCDDKSCHRDNLNTGENHYASFPGHTCHWSHWHQIPLNQDKGATNSIVFKKCEFWLFWQKHCRAGSEWGVNIQMRVSFKESEREFKESPFHSLGSDYYQKIAQSKITMIALKLLIVVPV